MPLENATLLKDLDPTQPLGTDPLSSADDHIRLIKAVLKATFPNLEAPVSLTAAALNAGLAPKGFIGLWSGAAAAIPSGWFLCDGTNSTPDLRDRFVVGAGGSYAVAATGGAVNAATTTAGSHTHTTDTSGTHSHTGTVAGHALTVDEMPSHHHASAWGESKPELAPWGVDGMGGGNAGSGQTDYDNFHYNTSNTGNGLAHSHGLTVDTGGAHSHQVNANGDHSHTVDTRSPYFALCYIMKG